MSSGMKGTATFVLAEAAVTVASSVVKVIQGCLVRYQVIFNPC